MASVRQKLKNTHSELPPRYFGCRHPFCSNLVTMIIVTTTINTRFWVSNSSSTPLLGTLR